MYELGEQTSYVGGRYLASTTGQTFESVEPATGKPIARVEVAGEREIQRAVEDAREGFRSWSAMKGAERGRILMRAVGLIRERKDALARLEVLDTGKPIFEARSVDIDSGADCLEYFAGLAAGIQGDCVDLDHAFVYTRREPLGVCVRIGAWNYPFQFACWKAAPALAAGNAMIFKPAELTPLSALKLAEILTEAGVPNGVFNVVHGFADTGRLLVRHPHVAKVSLTGEVATGCSVSISTYGLCTTDPRKTHASANPTIRPLPFRSSCEKGLRVGNRRCCSGSGHLWVPPVDRNGSEGGFDFTRAVRNGRIACSPALRTTSFVRVHNDAQNRVSDIPSRTMIYVCSAIA